MSEQEWTRRARTPAHLIHDAVPDETGEGAFCISLNKVPVTYKRQQCGAKCSARTHEN